MAESTTERRYPNIIGDSAAIRAMPGQRGNDDS